MNTQDRTIKALRESSIKATCSEFSGTGVLVELDHSATSFTATAVVSGLRYDGLDAHIIRWPGDKGVRGLILVRGDLASKPTELVAISKPEGKQKGQRS